MKLAILGSALAGGAVQIVDILLSTCNYTDLRIYDDSPEASNSNILGVSVVGSIERLLPDFSDGLVDSFIVAIGSIEPRKRVFESFFGSGLQPVNVISPEAIISNSSSIGVGNVILPLAYLGPRVVLGNNNYITTSSVVNHDTLVGSHCYFSTSVSIAGRVTVGDCVRLDTSCSLTADAFVSPFSHIGPGQCYGPSRGR